MGEKTRFRPKRRATQDSHAVADRQTVLLPPTAHRGDAHPGEPTGGIARLTDPLSVWLAVLPGMAEVTVAELARLGHRATAARGGLQVALPAGSLPELLGRLRTAEQLLIDCGQTAVADVADLDRIAGELAVRGWLRGPAPRWVLHATALTTSLAARLQRALDARPDPRPGDADHPPTVVHLTVARAAAVLAIDPAGYPLHQRGYRLAPGPAPLRETLAAAALQWAGHQPGMTVWDPCCGSGTFGIEALLAERPVNLRPWACVPAPSPANVPIAGLALCGDFDAEQVGRTLANAERGGVAGRLCAEVREMAAWSPDPTIDLIASNLPWGDRLGSRADARRIVQRWAAAVARTAPDRPAVVVVAEPQLADDTGLRDRRVLATRNGGKAVWLVAGRTVGRRP